MTRNIRVECNNCKNDFGLSRKIRQSILEEYKTATWNFILEHARLTKDKSKTIVSFGVKDRANFEGRVWARNTGYEREWKKPIFKEYKEIQNDINFKKVINHHRRYLIKISNKSLILKFIFKFKGLI